MLNAAVRQFLENFDTTLCVKLDAPSIGLGWKTDTPVQLKDRVSNLGNSDDTEHDEVSDISVLENAAVSDLVPRDSDIRSVLSDSDDGDQLSCLLTDRGEFKVDMASVPRYLGDLVGVL